MIEIRIISGETIKYDKSHYRYEGTEKGISIFVGAILVAFFNFNIVDMFLVREVID